MKIGFFAAVLVMGLWAVAAAPTATAEPLPSPWGCKAVIDQPETYYAVCTDQDGPCFVSIVRTVAYDYYETCLLPPEW